MKRPSLPIFAVLAALAIVALPAAALCVSCCAPAPEGVAAPGCCDCDGSLARPGMASEGVLAAGTAAPSAMATLATIVPASSILFAAPAPPTAPTGTPPSLGLAAPSPRRL